MTGRFGVRICPRCGEPVGMYYYKWDEQGRKVHMDCEEVRDVRVE